MSDGNVRVLTAGGAAHPNLVNRGGVAGKGPKSKSKTSKKGGNAAEDISVDDNDKAFAFPSNKDSVRDNGVEPTENVSLEYETSGGRVSNDKNNNSTATQTTVGDGNDNRYTGGAPQTPINDMTKKGSIQSRLESEGVTPVKIEDLYQEPPQSSKARDLIWLFICFVGIMASFVLYGLLLEYTTSGGRKLHELSFLFVTSGLYTITAAAGRYVRGETPTTIPPPRFAILGLTSMGSTFTSVRSLRYVIYPIQVLAKSCKPVPVMLMGTLMGKRYDLRKYINVVMIVLGVALFMGGGSSSSKSKGDDEKSASSQLFGIFLLFLSLCFDGGTGAYEDKLMSVHSVQPFDLMYNIQLGKTILAGVSLLVLNQLHIFIQMCHEMGFLLVALGLSGALGQVFIFVTIAKFGALTCSIIGLARKITTLLASIYFYGHHLNGVQISGLVLSVAAMIMNFMGKSKKGGGHGHGHTESTSNGKDNEKEEELRKILAEYHDEEDDDDDDGDVELAGGVIKK